MRHRPTHPVGKFVGKVTLLVLIDALHVELPTFSNYIKGQENQYVPVNEKDWVNKKGSFISQRARLEVLFD